ncbi:MULTISPECIES: hypothetical protein [unclassified Cytobacillus]|uniref:hypothetical protein n=1 Tax=unclassified Cytobacillus TaxID=2675268 RepID=UPI0013581E3B|nr:hypothetical protein [Cytobacillus sp. AMY 15.2]KAF0816823.1 hypothetical protein KIS4809_4295 [Bacillus sp. ZZV12-4809]MCM3090156.1 hypothetical protein [Cytobacillus sp. AMY 15.2]
MGYILPVTSYQYKQYAERKNSTKYDPFRFVPVARISAQSNPKAFHQALPLDVQRRFPKSNTQEQAEKTRTDGKKADDIYGDLTGKGRFISECI